MLLLKGREQIPEVPGHHVRGRGFLGEALVWGVDRE